VKFGCREQAEQRMLFMRTYLLMINEFESCLGGRVVLVHSISSSFSSGSLFC
jgi:hypothetical protein